MYEGNENYIFISYSHKDIDRIRPVIEWLEKSDYRIWYDDGIHTESEWPEAVANHLNECFVFMPFISQNYMDSQNCVRELHFAVSKAKQFITVLLGDVTLTPAVEMQIGITKAIHMDIFTDEMFFNSLQLSNALKSCAYGSNTQGAYTGLDELVSQSFEAVCTDKKKRKGRIAVAVLACIAAAVALMFAIPRTRTLIIGKIHEIENKKVMQDAANEEITDPDTLKWLGDIFYYQDKDYAKALEKYSKAFEYKTPDSYCAMGVLYRDGLAVEKDLDKAEKYLLEAYELGSEQAVFELGDFYNWAAEDRIDYEKAFKYYSEAVDNHIQEIWADYHLGVFYRDGTGVKKDYGKAIDYLKKASALGNSQADVEMGFMYLNGEGVECDTSKALEYFKKAADAGNEDGKVLYQNMKTDN